jgi:hypothetical protein
MFLTFVFPYLANWLVVSHPVIRWNAVNLSSISLGNIFLKKHQLLQNLGCENLAEGRIVQAKEFVINLYTNSSTITSINAVRADINPRKTLNIYQRHWMLWYSISWELIFKLIFGDRVIIPTSCSSLHNVKHGKSKMEYFLQNEVNRKWNISCRMKYPRFSPENLCGIVVLHVQVDV